MIVASNAMSAEEGQHSKPPFYPIKHKRSCISTLACHFYSTTSRSWSFFAQVLLIYFTYSLIAHDTMMAAGHLQEHACRGYQMRNDPYYARDTRMAQLKAMQNCTVIEGDVWIMLSTRPNLTHDDYEYYRLPNVVEITGSLLLFQVKGLRSLSQLFPNLRVIRGQTLVHNYALVLFQNQDLVEIGLPQLTKITGGGVRIVENPNLCYTDTIRWDKIVKDGAHILMENNQDPNQCSDQCEVKNETVCERKAAHSNTEPDLACWNFAHCQLKCPARCRNACNVTHGFCCHEECLGGCSGPTNRDCYACAHVRHQDQCVAKCPNNYYMFYRRRCVTRQECLNIKPPEEDEFNNKRYFKPVNNCCTLECPKGYEEPEHDKRTCVRCKGPCKKRCHGITITSLQDAESLKGCDIVHGYLEISIRSSVDENFVKRLKDSVGQISEVTEYVKIVFSPSFVSLSMFKNLQVIHGEKLWNKDQYALSVFENENLAELWNVEPGRKPLRILRGKVQFQNNPMLCHNTIMRFVESIEMVEFNVTEHDTKDISDHSNGNKAICEELGLKLDMRLVDSEDVVLQWEEFNTSMMDSRMFLGYRLFYKEVQHPNVSINEDRDACHDSWTMQFIAPTERGALVTQLKPNTLYAFYVSTLTINSPGAKGGISDVLYLRTLFSPPSPPVLKNATAVSAETIFIQWLPPRQPNGVITHYMLSYTPLPDSRPEGRNYCINPPVSHLSARDRPEGGKRLSQNSRSGSPASSSTSSALQRFMEKDEEKCEAHNCCLCSSPDNNTAMNNSRKESVKENKVDKETDFGVGTELDPNQEWKATERAIFENHIHNIVFSKNSEFSFDSSKAALKSRKLHNDNFMGGNAQDMVMASLRHPISSYSCWNMEEELEESQRRARSAALDTSYESQRSRDGVISAQSNLLEQSRSRRSVRVEKALPDPEITKPHAHVNVQAKDVTNDPVWFNVTGNTSVVLKNLTHYTSYEIKIWACQNESLSKFYCSNQPVTVVKRTLPLLEKDSINQSSIQVVNGSEKSDNSEYEVKWRGPEDPNGLLVSFKLRIFEVSAEKSSNLVREAICIPVNETKRFWSTKHKLEPGNYSISVRAVSLHGAGPWTQEIYFLVPASADWNTIIWIVVVTVLTFLLVAFCVGAYIYAKRRKKFKEELYAMWTRNPDYMSQGDFYKADEWELKRSDIEIGSELGKGNFGVVVKGFGKKNAVSSVCGVTFGPCAVKMTREGLNIGEQHFFLREAMPWKKYKSAFIVTLYGVISDGQPSMIVMEFMERGNLRDYLRSRRPGSDENIENLPEPSLSEQRRMAGEIADGMAYLESQKFVHRDLAARNIMVAQDYTCKIGDFGMAREIENAGDYYVPQGRGLAPIRWMSPEAVRDAKFSSKSDVWAYGVVLWEIVTLGQHPYGDRFPDNHDVLNHVSANNHLSIPSPCPPEFASLMKCCWSINPRSRPSFADVVKQLLPHMSDNFRQVSYCCSTLLLTPACTAASGNGNAACSPNTTGDESAEDSDTPLNPGSLEYTGPTLQGIAEDSEINTPICSNNRRRTAQMPKSFSIPGGQCIEVGAENHRPFSPYSDRTESDSRSKCTPTGEVLSQQPLPNGSILNGEIPSGVIDTTTPSKCSLEKDLRTGIMMAKS